MKRLLSFFLVFNVFLVFAQDRNKIFVGQLLDAETQEPIQNAHIFSNSKSATVSNVYGEFSLYVVDKDTLTVSCIGYQTTKILLANYPNFEDKLYVFNITPIIYPLSMVEIPYDYSVVIIPAEKREKINVEGVAPLNEKQWKIKVNEDINLKFADESNFGKKVPGIPNVGPTLYITGLLTSMFDKETKKEREAKEIIEKDKRTIFFDSYMKSNELREILMNKPYNMSQEEYENFIENFILKAGKVKFATNEYDILQKIAETLEPNNKNK
ncbi:carboxypeptidase-like regulatory domain-containing protein [Bacteroidales bacterium OttesenSCG-928-K03]|nr:carboxypeptidase-like regulatory domain-containing protein [Bacteroidales bacterium OttesenSCG-928-L14]MDL2240992.1 carboxypeptidase-like regulatory domain-containing protein [Bacteroidales bacterium OttesenSCG-928-K22]MDL2242181.1 carboxypeptidase-like regulatory domain-containing protein [Bacteroidales bacterium OttesenSCG-928-K03]